MFMQTNRKSHMLSDGAHMVHSLLYGIEMWQSCSAETKARYDARHAAAIYTRAELTS